MIKPRTYVEPDICDFNSSPPSTAYKRPQTGSALVQAMACGLSGTKLFPDPMLPYCQLDPWEQTSVKFESKWKNFSFMKMPLKLSSAKWLPFCPGGGELI